MTDKSQQRAAESLYPSNSGINGCQRDTKALKTSWDIRDGTGN